MDEIKDNGVKAVIEEKTPEKSKESNVLEQKEAEKKEQERTTTNKGLFLKHYKDHRVYSVVCKKIDIDYSTVWQWRKDDHEFAEAIRKIDEQRNDAAEDILLGLVFIKHDAPSVRYYLEKQHPEYAKHSEVDMNINPAISMKQFLEAYAQRNDKPAGSGDTPANKEQEGKDSAVREQSSPTDLLGKENKEEPMVEAPTKGTE
jgi:hypothetical protein